MIVSYNGLELDDSATYFLYIADLEKTDSLVYSNARWALAGGGILGNYSTVAFYAPKNASDITPFQFSIVHGNKGTFQIVSVNNKKALRLKNYLIPLNISLPMFNVSKDAEYPGFKNGEKCMDDFDCAGTQICGFNGSVTDRSCVNQTGDIVSGYKYNYGGRYSGSLESEFVWENTYTRGCKWTNCLSYGRCNSSALLLNPGNQFAGNDGWKLNGQTSKHPNGSYYCGWLHETHYACCPRSQVAIAGGMFDTYSSTVVNFGALAAGKVEGQQSAILKVRNNADELAFCGVTDYRKWTADVGSIPFLPKLVPVKTTLPDVWDSGEDSKFTYYGDQTRSRKTKFRIVFSKVLLT